MAHSVLRHGGLPAVDFGEKRPGAQAKDFLQVFSDDGDDFCVASLGDTLGYFSGEEAAQHSAIRGGAVREFVMDKGCGEKIFSFAAGDKKSEAGRERFADLAIKA